MSDDRALFLSSICTSFLLIGFGLSAGYLEIESGYLDLVHRPHVSCNSCAGFFYRSVIGSAFGGWSDIEVRSGW